MMETGSVADGFFSGWWWRGSGDGSQANDYSKFVFCHNRMLEQILQFVANFKSGAENLFFLLLF